MNVVYAMTRNVYKLALVCIGENIWRRGDESS